MADYKYMTDMEKVLIWGF